MMTRNLSFEVQPGGSHLYLSKDLASRDFREVICMQNGM